MKKQEGNTETNGNVKPGACLVMLDLNRCAPKAGPNDIWVSMVTPAILKTIVTSGTPRSGKKNKQTALKTYTATKTLTDRQTENQFDRLTSMCPFSSSWSGDGASFLPLKQELAQGIKRSTKKQIRVSGNWDGVCDNTWSRVCKSTRAWYKSPFNFVPLCFTCNLCHS